VVSPFSSVHGQQDPEAHPALGRRLAGPEISVEVRIRPAQLAPVFRHDLAWVDPD
jgi:hypothetical protein